MTVRQVLNCLLLFLLPGCTAGWIISAHALRFYHDPVVSGVIFSAFALAGALTGRWMFRHRPTLGAGLLCLLALPVLTTRGLLPAGAFAFGVFAVHPMRPVNRLFFQAGVLLAVSAAMALGGRSLANPCLAKSSLFLLLPAAANLVSSGRAAWKTTGVLVFLAGITFLLIPWKIPSGTQHTLLWGEYANLVKSEKTSVLRMGNRVYILPRDLDRKMPDLLTAALQPQAEFCRALVIEEAPSSAHRHLQKLHWISEVDRAALLLDPQSLLRTEKGKYDLIFIQELPGGATEAQHTLFCYILQTRLAPGGVLAAPAEYRCSSPGFHSALLPGSRGKLCIWAEKNTPLADTFEKLESRLNDRNSAFAENSIAGMMQTLYEMRASEPDLRQSATHPIARKLYWLGSHLPDAFILLPAVLLLLLGVCWFSRSPRYGENFAIFVHGTACMLCMLILLQEAGKYQLILPTIPLAALFGFIAMALPCRTEKSRIRRIPAIICAAVMGAILLPDLPLGKLVQCGIPENMIGLLLLPPMFLLAPVMKTGCLHNGAESARYLHFAGLLAGAVLALLVPHWAVMLAALLLLAA